MKLAALIAMSAGVMSGACSIRGKVVDVAGRPAAGAAVVAARELTDPRTGKFGALTDAEGAFCIAVQPGERELPPGNYTLHVMAGSGPVSSVASCRDCCGPASDTVSGPVVAVTVAARTAVEGVTIRLRRGALYCVRGEVRSRSGRRASRATAELVGNGYSTTVVLDGAGRFLVSRVPAGRYLVRVWSGFRGGNVLGQQTVLVRNRNVDGVMVSLE